MMPRTFWTNQIFFGGNFISQKNLCLTFPSHIGDIPLFIGYNPGKLSDKYRALYSSESFLSHCDLMVSRSQAKIVENFANNF